MNTSLQATLINLEIGFVYSVLSVLCYWTHRIILITTRRWLIRPDILLGRSTYNSYGLLLVPSVITSRSGCLIPLFLSGNTEVTSKSSWDIIYSVISCKIFFEWCQNWYDPRKTRRLPRFHLTNSFLINVEYVEINCHCILNVKQQMSVRQRHVARFMVVYTLIVLDMCQLH